MKAFNSGHVNGGHLVLYVYGYNNIENCSVVGIFVTKSSTESLNLKTHRLNQVSVQPVDEPVRFQTCSHLHVVYILIMVYEQYDQ